MERLKYFFINIIVPALAHFSILGFLSTVDPCNNSTCMAGTATIYFLMIVSPPTILILLIAAAIQSAIGNPNYSKYLKINLAIAILPYVLIGIALFGVELFT